MIDLLVIKDLVENPVVQMKWVSTVHMLTDILAQEMPMTEVFKSFLEGGIFAVHQTCKQTEQEEHRKHLRQQQRHRRKE